MLDYTSTAVANGDTFPGAALSFTYNAETGNLDWVSRCPFPLQRLVGETLEADCTSGFCGDVELTGCGTDCDCGHCWYCEDGTCRYGGEGPFGCFRGCPF